MRAVSSRHARIAGGQERRRREDDLHLSSSPDGREKGSAAAPSYPSRATDCDAEVVSVSPMRVMCLDTRCCQRTDTGAVRQSCCRSEVLRRLLRPSQPLRHDQPSAFPSSRCSSVAPPPPLSTFALAFAQPPWSGEVSQLPPLDAQHPRRPVEDVASARRVVGVRVETLQLSDKLYFSATGTAEVTVRGTSRH